jgi:hypothetical protein
MRFFFSSFLIAQIHEMNCLYSQFFVSLSRLFFSYCFEGTEPLELGMRVCTDRWLCGWPPDCGSTSDVCSLPPALFGGVGVFLLHRHIPPRIQAPDPSTWSISCQSRVSTNKNISLMNPTQWGNSYCCLIREAPFKSISRQSSVSINKNIFLINSTLGKFILLLHYRSAFSRPLVTNQEWVQVKNISLMNPTLGKFTLLPH